MGRVGSKATCHQIKKSELFKFIYKLSLNLQINWSVGRWPKSWTPALWAFESPTVDHSHRLQQDQKKFQFRIEDDELDGSVFKNVGSLAKFIEFKTAAVNKAS